MAGVFVNYRAKDNPVAAAAIARVLTDNFGRELVFRDCVSMAPGEPYPQAIRQALREADVLVAVVGPDWLAVDPSTGRPRVEAEDDWVRMEIAHALSHGIPVVPVLLHDTPENARAPRHHELPSSIRRFASIQAARFSQRRFDQDMAALVERLVDLVPTLAVPRLFVQPVPTPGADVAPSVLLRAEHGVVPFSGRQRELADLVAWANDPATSAVRLLVGRPGSGRRRLALELCDRLRRTGWFAGVLDGEAPAAQIRRAGTVDKPLLVVVPDGELRSERLAVLAEALVDRSSARGATSRLLVLGRSAGTWLTPLRDHADRRVAALFADADRVGAMALDGVPAGATPEAAVAAFADVLGLPVRPQPAGRPETVLDLHALALGAVLGSADRGDPPARVLDHDRDRWRAATGDHSAPETARTALAVIGTLATLCAPASRERAEALIARLPEVLGEDSAAVQEYVGLFSRLYPGPHPVNALSPDLLGERLVADTLTAQPLLVTTLVAVFPDEWLTSALTVLGRALPRRHDLAPVVQSLFRAAPHRVEPLVFDVVTRLADPEPLARAIAEEMATVDRQVPDVVSLLMKLAGADQARDPLRGATIDAMLDAARKFTDRLAEHSGTTVPPHVRRIVDAATDTVRDFLVGGLDPGSGRMPIKPDGKPILPPGTLTLLRDLFHTRPKGDEEEDG
ncbi:TIR domain-containing protein [Saccharothrix texasensis]|uniref:TIR domain-containing protein n=1 Tax=Saccharothrix texasensis TaxID=103734 RepID=A0A3N1HHQ8_9PSEU|nr:toll/interleukin-1 receptor domain-containing protein [Saccharothrix texasensis]ROP42025.1 TIR domain-containing protein [Saccharothrix texasensis]